MTFKNLKIELKNNQLIISNLQISLADTIFYTIRRIANSIVPSIRIFAFEIEGIKHDYENIPFVKEHIIDVTKNLSSIDLHINNENIKDEIILGKVSKKGEITTDDIVFEGENKFIISKKQYICYSNEELNLNLYFNLGRGFVDKNKNISYMLKHPKLLNKHLVFLHVNYATLVKFTHEIKSQTIDKFNVLETLIINFEPDYLFAVKFAIGTIFDLFNNIKNQLEEPLITEKEINLEEQKIYTDSINNDSVMSEIVDINILNLKLRVVNALKQHNINSIQKLLNFSFSELKKLDGITEKMLQAIEEELSKKDLKLRTDE